MREFRAKYSIPILLLFVQASLCSQTDTAYSFIVAGHALNPDIDLPALALFSVPGIPDHINGPGHVAIPGYSIEYSVPEVFNAESYEWSLPQGAQGSSVTNTILADFTENFAGGELRVRSFRDGFGHSEDAVLGIEVDFTGARENEIGKTQGGFAVLHASGEIIVRRRAEMNFPCRISIFDCSGRKMLSVVLTDQNRKAEIHFPDTKFSPGLLILSIESEGLMHSEKFLLF